MSHKCNRRPLGHELCEDRLIDNVALVARTFQTGALANAIGDLKGGCVLAMGIQMNLPLIYKYAASAFPHTAVHSGATCHITPGPQNTVRGFGAL